MSDDTSDSDKPSAAEAEPAESGLDESDSDEAGSVGPADGDADNAEGTDAESIDGESNGVDASADVDADADSEPSAAGADAEPLSADVSDAASGESASDVSASDGTASGGSASGDAASDVSASGDAASGGSVGDADLGRTQTSDGSADAPSAEASSAADAANAADAAGGSGSGRSRWRLDGRMGRVLAVVGAAALAAVVIAGVVWAGSAIFDRDGRSDRGHRGDDGRHGERFATFDEIVGDKRGAWSIRSGKSSGIGAGPGGWHGPGDGRGWIIMRHGGLNSWHMGVDGTFDGKDTFDGKFGKKQRRADQSSTSKRWGDLQDDPAERKRGDWGKDNRREDGWGTDHWGKDNRREDGWGGDGWGKNGWDDWDRGNGRRPGMLPDGWFRPDMSWGRDRFGSRFGGQGLMAPFGPGWFGHSGPEAPDIPGGGLEDFWSALLFGADEGPFGGLDELFGGGSDLWWDDSWWNPDDLDPDERAQLAQFCAALQSGALFEDLEGDDETSIGLMLFGAMLLDGLLGELCPSNSNDLDPGTEPGTDTESDDDA